MRRQTDKHTSQQGSQGATLISKACPILSFGNLGQVQPQFFLICHC